MKVINNTLVKIEDNSIDIKLIKDIYNNYFGLGMLENGQPVKIEVTVYPIEESHNDDYFYNNI